MRYLVNSKNRIRVFLLFWICLFLITPVAAEIRLPSVIGSHMVLQQDKPIQVWGWAEPGENISVMLDKKKAAAHADKKGKWITTLDAMKSGGGSLTMTISGDKSQTVNLKNILIGEVWICSGQSNMQWSLERAHSPLPEINRADFPYIRLFTVPMKVSLYPQGDVDSKWEVCGPETIGSFSAVAYYFGRSLHKKLNVPIGLINTSWGGTRIEPWTPPCGFKSVPELHGLLEERQEADKEYKKVFQKALPDFKKWVKMSEKALDLGKIIPSQPELPRHSFDTRESPSALFNAMIHPLLRFAIRGAIWYQGESNLYDGLLYAKKMEALIYGWRQVWRTGDFPFYYVQLAPFHYPHWEYESDNITPYSFRLPLIWEAQSNTLKLPNTGMVVVSDITNLYDIHPRNKKDVGDRLSLWALAKTYGKKGLVYSGPLYRSKETEGSKIRVQFDHTGSGLISLDGSPLWWFEIAGADRTFYKAQAEISGDNVVVWCDKVPEPAAVRYGWHQMASPKLGNKEGLPASPFRTDRW